jgi:tetratricopeptide (TPR) repeat protein
MRDTIRKSLNNTSGGFVLQGHCGGPESAARSDARRRSRVAQSTFCSASSAAAARRQGSGEYAKMKNPRQDLLSRILFAAVLATALSAGAAVPEHGQLDASPALFTVMAAINAAGYDAELNSPSNHPLRAAVRKEIAGKKLASVEALRQFFVMHRQKDETAELSQYISFGLSVTGPPDFAYKGRMVDLPPDVPPLEGLGALMARFYEEAGIEALWNQSQPAFEQVIARYHEPVTKAVLEVNSYLRNPTAGYLGRQFQIYLDLLGAPNQIQTRSYGNDYYVVVTPSPEPQVEDIRHAYLHYLLDPLATKFAENVMKKRALGDLAQAAPALEPYYKSDFLLLTTESLIKAIEARLNRKPEAVGLALRDGYILAPYFSEYLPRYEKQKQSMRFHFPDMIDEIDLKAEDRRLQGIEFVSAPRVRQAKVVAAERKLEPTGAQKSLEEAEQFYAGRELERARQSYTKVLQQTSEKTMHAQSYYGLARIAVLQKQPEAAEQLFQKAIESSPEPYVLAWSHVYLGRLSDAAGDREQASRHYQIALNVDGASQAAHRAAEQGIKQSFKKPE